MGLQIKMFENGVKAVLKPQGKGRQLLQVFDQENCLIAQREIQSSVNSGLLGSSRKLEKLTIRKNKESEGLVEYLKTTTSPNYGWSSRRVVRPEYSDTVYINNNDGLMPDGTHYFNESYYRNTDLHHLKLPLLKKTEQPKTKLDEITETFDSMWSQWVNPKNGKIRKEVKPMMSKTLQSKLESMA